MFDRYELRSKLGQGGMGQVWRAFDRTTDRHVALKVLPAELANDRGYRARFEREARAAAKLQHPNIVPIHNFGEVDGRLFIDMALLEGRDLDALIRNTGPLPLTQVAHVISQVAGALDAAHDAGLVHRDVKPSNIFVHPGGHAYLIDFGIVHADGQEGLTSGSRPIGTPAYMAPERYDGKAGPEGDIYALACVMFECLTGRRPFDGASIAQQIAAHLTKPPPQPTMLVPSLPTILDEIIARGMAKDPTDRYLTATALARTIAASGEADAMVNLGDMLAQQDPPDTSGARRWFEQAAAAGNPEGMSRLGRLLEELDPPDRAGARRWYEKAAAAGDPSGMYYLGYLLENDMDPPDIAGARRWYEKSARAGNVFAMADLGYLLTQQDPPDIAGARRWYEKSARAGNVSGMAGLGDLLAQLDPPDFDGARQWYQPAAAAGSTYAMRKLGDLLENRLDPPDLDGAHIWYERAAAVQKARNASRP
ncbi:serine/threonine-protein kinase [Rhodococcus sp. NCIMB 12038]|uniref:serine/threonine-protein kinase n=1 Tax=Rhodococcus sp. NCIMB 12038 TaxID=933800 RepID=UPI00211B44BC|nr:serine/threonine-protein kinase [Rhodococcus sp. NCIMB 12038]